MCGGDGLLGGGKEREKELTALSKWPGGLVVLTDPDQGGRDLRMFLDEVLVQRPLEQRAKAQAKQGQAQQLGQTPQGPPVLHAFVHVDEARSTVANRCASCLGREVLFWVLCDAGCWVAF